MIERIIELSKHRWIVFGATALLIVWSTLSSSRCSYGQRLPPSVQYSEEWSG